MLTTYRVVYMSQGEGVEIPLCYVSGVAKSGGLFQKDGVYIMAANSSKQQPPYIIDLYKNVLKKNDLPKAPEVPPKVKISFLDKNRDNFLNLLEEALKRKGWTVALRTTANQQQQMQSVKPAGAVIGISGYKKTVEANTNYN